MERKDSEKYFCITADEVEGLKGRSRDILHEHFTPVRIDG